MKDPKDLNVIKAQYYHGDVAQSFIDLRNLIKTLEEDVKLRDEQTREKIEDAGIAKPSACALVRPVWKDDGKHRNKNISYWEGVSDSYLDDATSFFYFEGNDQMYSEDIEEALQSAEDLLANDPTGYAEMHSVKGGSDD